MWTRLSWNQECFNIKEAIKIIYYMSKQKRKIWFSQTDSRKILSWYDKKYMKPAMIIIDVDGNLDVPIKIIRNIVSFNNI